MTIYIALGVVVLFCLLDTYYLYLERGYRKLYKIAAKLEVPSKPLLDFDMQIPKSERGIVQYSKAFLSVSTGLFYGVIMLLLTILWLCTNAADTPSM